MSSTIGTQSILNPSIFSRSESYLSANTQWTSDASIKLDNGGIEVASDDRQKSSRQMGRPANKWTCSRLRKLIRLYLLTDLELDSIIDRLRTKDFRPCKRNVQEKLNLLLQPQPNKIRPKGDTKVLRRLLLECSKLQKTRRLKTQQHRGTLEQRRGPLRGNIVDGERGGPAFSTTKSVTDLSCAAPVPPVTLEPVNCRENLLGTEALGLVAQDSLLPEDGDRSFLDSAPTIDFELSSSQFNNLTSDVPVPFFDWDRLDCGPLPQHTFHTPEENDPGHSIYYSSGYNDDLRILFPNVRFNSDSDSQFPDLGFGSDFGPRPIPKSSLMPPMSGITNDFGAMGKIDDGLHCNIVTQSSKIIVPSNPQGRCPVVNSTHLRDTFDTESRSLYSYSDFDAATTFALEVGQFQLGFPDHANQAECPPVRRTENSMSIKGDLDISRPFSSSSKITSFLNRMSLSSSSALLDGQTSPTSANSCTVLSMEVKSPIILPGVFPEYCWQHMNKNTLRRCSEWDGSQMCYSKHHRISTPTHRSLRVDIFSRIVQRKIRPKDIHEIDTFGNSIIHISATMLAPPSYLISLIKMGANVNRVNNAGQTFLHLVKPGVLDHCNDFCYLLEILSVEGFNFCQHDHLGQSPLHLLMRPWIRSDILHAIITKLDSLLIHRHLSTARDCFGYTVVGQMNLQGANSSGTDLDQVILSLACETEKRIVDPRDLQTSKSWRKELRNIDRGSERNYENHPSIKTVEDLLQYEQHIDYWRTIVAAKTSPSAEDSNGRNGLHCLAESSLVSSDMPLPSALLGQLESLKDMNYADTDNDRECFIKSLLDAGVDPSNYDNTGNTPLMAFISNNRAHESDECLSRILRLLLEKGSDIGRRNRRGETALHLAIKLGRRAATGVLLASGANIHARTSSGLGVLELGQKHCLENKEDENLFGQIMVCMSLAASFGAVSEPTILDEWGSPEWRLNTQPRSERNGFKLVKKFIDKKAHGRREGKCSVAAKGSTSRHQ